MVRPRRARRRLPGAALDVVLALGVVTVGLACALRFLLPPTAPVFPGAGLPLGGLAPDAQGPAGWTQVFADDFPGDEVPSAAGDLPDGRWWGYPTGTPVTNSADGVYDPPRVVRVADGALTFTGTADGQASYGAVLAPRTPGPQTYGRYDVRYRYLASEIGGFRAVWMLWPDSDDWGEGEIDVAEYRESTAARVSAAVHQACGSAPCRYTVHDVGLDPLGWHTATAIWSPGRVTTYLDGRELTTTGQSVPDTPMHLLLQFEASSAGVPAPPGASVGVQVDWVAVYRRD